MSGYQPGTLHAVEVVGEGGVLDADGARDVALHGVIAVK